MSKAVSKFSVNMPDSSAIFEYDIETMEFIEIKRFKRLYLYDYTVNFCYIGKKYIKSTKYELYQRYSRNEDEISCIYNSKQYTLKDTGERFEINNHKVEMPVYCGVLPRCFGVYGNELWFYFAPYGMVKIDEDVGIEINMNSVEYRYLSKDMYTTVIPESCTTFSVQGEFIYIDDIKYSLEGFVYYLIDGGVSHRYTLNIGREKIFAEFLLFDEDYDLITAFPLSSFASRQNTSIPVQHGNIFVYSNGVIYLSDMGNYIIDLVNLGFLNSLNSAYKGDKVFLLRRTKDCVYISISNDYKIMYPDGSVKGMDINLKTEKSASQMKKVVLLGGSL